MSENPQHNTPTADEQIAFIPPHYLLILAGIGLLIALGVGLTQPQFTVVGWGGLGLALLSTLAWMLMAPEQFMAVLRGRTVRYGGTALFVTIVFLVALVAVYVLVREQGLRVDISETETFSLTEDAREVVTTYAADPLTPPIEILAFYGITQAGQRDRATILFDDYVEASDGKISYTFIDPDRNPASAELFNARSGSIVVVPLDANGERIVDSAEPLPTFQQEQITNAIARVSLQGDFRAYFLSLNGLPLEAPPQGGPAMSELNSILESLDWQVQEITFADLIDPAFDLNSPEADGEVLIISGGSSEPNDEAIRTITDYLDAGGDVVIFADVNPEGEDSLFTGSAFSDYLSQNFGLRVRNDLVIDPTMQSPLSPLAEDLATQNVIMQPTFTGGQGFVGIFFNLAHSIEVAPAPPPNVTVTELARTVDQAYAKSDVNLNEITDMEDLAQSPDDAQGPFVLAASAENTEIGSRVVIFGSRDVAQDNYATLDQLGIGNLNVSFNSIAWSANYFEFQENIPRIIPPQRPQDTPVFATEQDIRNINFITVIVLPFGILALGLLRWWFGRERAIET